MFDSILLNRPFIPPFVSSRLRRSVFFDGIFLILNILFHLLSNRQLLVGLDMRKNVQTCFVRRILDNIVH